MAMNRYGSDNTYLTINGIPLENYGDTDPPYVISDIEDRSVIKGGVGLTGLQLDNARRPRQLVVNLMPGSDEVRQLIALDKAHTPITATHRVGGTDEIVVLSDGVIQRRGDMGRAGKGSVSDESWTFIFLDSDET